ncbi:PAAR domain-containing protein [Tolumonas lignilytica]|uniref:PAAR domain-containing protein n=1 Tax=Tolumonas lignilytica TaxID=1283284 RepID=UPI0004642980|nr:PAAR domain-containing protein [Tolumonas lignilytica]
MPAIARVGDLHACPQRGHEVNAVVSGSSDVIINGMPAATVGSSTGCGGSIVTGSSTVTINGKPVAVLGSVTNHGGVIVSAASNVLIG